MSSNYAGMPGKTEAESVAQIVREGLQPSLCSAPTVIPVLLWPRSEKIQSLESLLAAPARKRAAIQVRDHSSFIDYVLKHAEPGTIVFAEITETGGSFIAVVDYHGNNELGANLPKWGDHTCKYVCEHTPEWKRWVSKSGKLQNQVEMALFIEDNLIDIRDPEAARMLELVKTLEATQGVEFKSAIRLNNGDRQLNFTNTTTARAGEKGDMEIPEKFKIKVPVFVNGPEYEVWCRFRYFINDGRLQLAYELDRPHKIIDLALAEARTAIVQTLAPIPVLLGAGGVAK